MTKKSRFFSFKITIYWGLTVNWIMQSGVREGVCPLVAATWWEEGQGEGGDVVKVLLVELLLLLLLPGYLW